ncbi:hypothetical protein GJ689_24855 [Rhodoplanes serenus]|uniref:Uncharacterized protein n=1 Tax=Rhodoplanes serenus TaxID=200615 RepID=A0A9X4XQG7_9BRAD|nr:hypothetical protein [Rhodoplanes serenus]MTW19425.1 hypothetical protein [Rhodoplanes serenus]
MAQAEPTHTTSPSRRSILRGAAAAPIVSVVGMAPFLADADVRFLASEAGRLVREFHAAQDVLNEAEARWKPPFRDSDEVLDAIDAAEARQDEAGDALLRVLRQLADIPATTIEGLQAKAQFAEHTDRWYADAVLRDLQAMGA